MRWASSGQRVAESSAVTAPRSSSARRISMRRSCSLWTLRDLRVDSCPRRAPGRRRRRASPRPRAVTAREPRRERRARPVVRGGRRRREVDGAVDDRPPRAQLAGLVVDPEHRVLPTLRHDDDQGAQAGGAWELAGLLVEGDPSVLLERQEDGALDADLLGDGRGESIEGVLGVRAEAAEPARQVGFSVLQAPEVGGEPREVFARARSWRLAWVSSGRASPFVYRGPRISCGSVVFMACLLR
jgi:hypothetical protein